MIMRKTKRYTHIPYCRIWSEIERLVNGRSAVTVRSTVYRQSPLIIYEVTLRVIRFREIPG
jgi:hypothetical protein